MKKIVYKLPAFLSLITYLIFSFHFVMHSEKHRECSDYRTHSFNEKFANQPFYTSRKIQLFSHGDKCHVCEVKEFQSENGVFSYKELGFDKISKHIAASCAVAYNSRHFSSYRLRAPPRLS